jgi:hypothetical protein
VITNVQQVITNVQQVITNVQQVITNVQQVITNVKNESTASVFFRCMYKIQVDILLRKYTVL